MIKNLLKIVLASLMLTSATGTAKAVTVDDLVQYGGDAIEIFYGNYVQRSFLDRSNGIKLVKTGDNTLLLKGFYGNSCDVPFKLVNNRLVLDYDDNTYYSVDVKSYNPNYDVFQLSPMKLYTNGKYDWRLSPYKSNIITETNGQYLIEFDIPLAIDGYVGNNSSGYTQKLAMRRNYFKILVYKPNVTITDHNDNANKDRAFNAQLTFVDDGTIKFLNWGDKGCALANDPIAMNTVFGPVTGGIDRSKSSVWLDYQLFTANIANCTSQAINLYGFRLVEKGSDGYFYKPLYGTINDLLAHHTGTSAWVTDGGDCTTLESMKMKFRTWTAYSEKSNDNAGQPVVSNTVVTVPDHDVTLQLQMTGASASNVKVAASWKATKNEFYVSSYDLMIVPGKYTTGAAVPLDKAVVVANVEKNTTGTYSVEGDYAAKVGDDYTLFIRANYTESTGLTPTYHCLSNVVAEAAGVTLADIIATGTDGETYTVANDLQAVYVSGNTVYAKDAQGFANRQECGDLRDTYDNKFFDQSNWVRITLADASAIVNGTVIKGGTLKGVFTRDANGNPSLDASAQSAPTTAEGAAYVGNLYNLANFAASQPSEGQGIFLVTPKPYEYARVQWAIINADQTTFSVPASIHYLCGTASIDWSLAEPGLKEMFNHAGEGYAYNFNAIVYRNKAMSETAGNEAIADGGWTIAPLNANGFDDISTGTPTVTTVKTVASVRYFTMVGVECADRTDAPCVKVVTYTDGTVEAIKLPRR